jgi:hypothetical protein
MLPGKMSGIAKGLTTAGLAVGTFFAAYKVTELTLKITGLDKVLAEFYAKWFTNADKAKAKGKELDDQLKAYNKQRWGDSGGPEKTTPEPTTQNAEDVKTAERLATIRKQDETAQFEHKLSMMDKQKQINALYARETDITNQALNATDKIKAAELYSAAQSLKFRRESLEFQMKEKKISDATKKDQARLSKIKTELNQRNQAIIKLDAPKLETTLTDAIEQGSFDALKLSSTQISDNDKISKHTKDTSKNTKDLIKEAKKIVKKLTSDSVSSSNDNVLVLN